MTRREAKTMLATGGWKKDPGLTKVIGLECFMNDRGQSLILLPGTRSGANVCDDRAALLRYALSVREMPPQHILEGLFPFGDSFPQEVPGLIAQLASETGIPLAELDATVESLQKVERAFRKRGGARSFLTGSRFPPVVAYIGEVLRNASTGEWKMELARGVWEPWIIAADGRRFAPFSIAYEELGRGRGGSIWGATRGRLWGHWLGGPPKGPS